VNDRGGVARAQDPAVAAFPRLPALKSATVVRPRTPETRSSGTVKRTRSSRCPWRREARSSCDPQHGRTQQCSRHFAPQQTDGRIEIRPPPVRRREDPVSCGPTPAVTRAS
jgi:hypothetical protein